MEPMSDLPLVILASKRPNLKLGPEDVLGVSSFLNPKCHSGAVAIVEDGELIGIFTERDLLKRVLAYKLDLKTTKFRDVMTADPVTISMDADLSEALDVITRSGFRYLPVVNGKECIGMIDVRDLYAAMNILIKDALDKQSEIFSCMMREPYGCSG